MTFEFGNVIPEKIYDNHGCPLGTVFSMKFSVNGKNFVAEFSDNWRGVVLYFEYEKIKTISPNNRLYADTVKYALRNAFLNDEDVKKFFHKINGDEIEVVKNELCEKLLKNDNWS